MHRAFVSREGQAAVRANAARKRTRRAGSARDIEKERESTRERFIFALGSRTYRAYYRERVALSLCISTYLPYIPYTYIRVYLYRCTVRSTHERKAIAQAVHAYCDYLYNVYMNASKRRMSHGYTYSYAANLSDY